MKTLAHLPKLASWILSYIIERQRELARLPTHSVPVASDATFPLVDTHNALATFMRTYCLSSLAGAYMSNGTRVTANRPIRGHRSALTFAIRTERPRATGKGPWSHRDEPTWHDPNVLVRILNKAACSNAAGVNAALSLGSNAIEHLTITRNFLAHRNETTAVKLRRLGSRYGVGAPTDPLAVVFAFGYGRPQRIVDDWLDDIFTIVSLFPR
jgi:hypothetical protein